MWQVFRYYITSQMGLPTLILLTFASVGLSLFTKPGVSVGQNSLVIIFTMPYLYMFTEMRKQLKDYSIKYNFPISNIKTNIAKFLSFYLYMAVALGILLSVDVQNGHVPMAILLYLLRQMSTTYIIISIIGRIFSLKNWEAVINIPNGLYLLCAVAVMYMLSFDRPDVLQLQGIPSDGIYGVMLYLSTLIFITVADFVTIHINSKKIVTV